MIQAQQRQIDTHRQGTPQAVASFGTFATRHDAPGRTRLDDLVQPLAGMAIAVEALAPLFGRATTEVLRQVVGDHRGGSNAIAFDRVAVAPHTVWLECQDLRACLLWCLTPKVASLPELGHLGPELCIDGLKGGRMVHLLVVCQLVTDDVDQPRQRQKLDHIRCRVVASAGLTRPSRPRKTISMTSPPFQLRPTSDEYVDG
jgi:hypothetical protein